MGRTGPVAELADAADLKSAEQQCSCGFESHRGHDMTDKTFRRTHNRWQVGYVKAPSLADWCGARRYGFLEAGRVYF